jgi:hypothetical protein
MRQQDGPPTPLKTILVQGVQLFGLSGFAVAQPLFGMLGNGPAFFITHGASRLDIVLLSAALLLVLPIALLIVVRLSRVISPDAPHLAMAALFGGFHAEFFDAYIEAWPMPGGWQQRWKLYQLYHVLNHVNLFGRGYLAQAEALVAELGGQDRA